MSKSFRNIAIVALLAGTLSACGSDNNSSNPGGPVVAPPAAKVEDAFGANFAAAFRADPNSIAKDPVPGDIIPLDLTKDPVPI